MPSWHLHSSEMKHDACEKPVRLLASEKWGIRRNRAHGEGLISRVVRGSLIKAMGFEETREAAERFCLNTFKLSIQAEGADGAKSQPCARGVEAGVAIGMSM